jgi:HSP20 family protein
MRTTYNIFDDIMGLRNVIDGFFEAHPTGYERRAEPPFVNVYEKNDVVTARFLTPGVQIKDIDLQLVDNDLMITTTRVKDLNDKPYIRRERTAGTYSKRVRIPFRANPESIKAELKDGILTVTLEKSEEAKPRKVIIQ